MAARFLGHPVHPMLVVFPMGLFPTSVLFDVVYLGTGNTTWTVISFWMIPVAIIGGLIAAVFGLTDWIGIPQGTRAKRVGAVHGVGNVVVVVLFALSWLIRQSSPESPVAAAYVLSMLGVALVMVTGWLGGELVDALGIGVRPGAHANAPSSLSRGPAQAIGQD